MGDKLEQRVPRAEVSVHMGELSSARQAFEQSSAGRPGGQRTVHVDGNAQQWEHGSI